MKKGQTLLKAKDIKNLTGWNTNDMRRARRNDYVEMRKYGSQIFYVLESIPEVFIKKTA